MSFESLASSYPQDCRIPHLENNSYIYGNPPSGQLAHSGVDFRVSNEKSDSKYQNFTSTPENIIKKSPERRYQDYYQRISLYELLYPMILLIRQCSMGLCCTQIPKGTSEAKKAVSIP